MKDINLKSRSIKLTKSRLLWRTGETITPDPYYARRGARKSKSGATPTMRFRTYAYSLPIDAIRVEHILINGKIAWAGEGRTGIIAGGGRFTHTRTLYDRCVVQQQIILRDIPYYGTKEPQITLILAFVDTAKLAKQALENLK